MSARKAKQADEPKLPTIPSVDEWQERIEIAVKRGCTPAKGGAHNYVVNGMRCLLAELSTPIGLLRLEEFAVEQRLDQEALDAVRAIAAKARGEQA